VPAKVVLGLIFSAAAASLHIVHFATDAGLIFVRFSNNGRLAVVVRVAAVFLILFILVIRPD
jgi:hypothetical protein